MQPLYLVRHGESEWNARRLIQGQTVHPGLTALGREQARSAARGIHDDLSACQLSVAVITTSDLVRAVQTAAILGDLLGCSIRSDPRLREQHLGSWQGLTVEQTGNVEVGGDGFSGGESARQLRERMVEAVHAVDRSVVNVLVSHGRAIRQAVGHATGLTEGTAERLRVRNGAVARLRDGRVDWLS